MIKYIFFDFDGTVSDAKRLTYETLIEVLDRMDFKFSKLRAKKLMGSKMQNILRGIGIDEKFVNKIRQKFYALLVKKASMENLKLCADITPLYELKKKGYKLIVISNAEKSFLKASMKVLGIKRLFYKVYGAEGFETKDEILKKLFKEYKIKPKEAMYVGDRFSDVDYAHDAHTYAVAIHNKCSWSSKKEILAENPDYIISDFEGLRKLVKKLNSRGTTRSP